MCYFKWTYPLSFFMYHYKKSQIIVKTPKCWWRSRQWTDKLTAIKHVTLSRSAFKAEFLTQSSSYWEFQYTVIILNLNVTFLYDLRAFSVLPSDKWTDAISLYVSDTCSEYSPNLSHFPGKLDRKIPKASCWSHNMTL